MAQIVNPIPYPLNGLGPMASGQFISTDIDYDYAIAGLPFTSAIDNEHPYTDRMAEIRKQQFDNFAEPGEQSLEGWWLRSQSTFTGGAGILYQDPDNDNQFNYKFADSLGVDPWTSGDMKLLRDTDLAQGSSLTPSRVQGYVTPAGVDAVWFIRGDAMSKITDASTTNVIVTGSGDTIHDISSTGATYIIAKNSGVWTGVDAGAPAQQYNTALTAPVIEFVKDRLVVTNANAVHEVALAPGGAPIALPAADYTHPDTAWRWKSITDGPTAIYAAGDSGTTSQIHKFTITDVGGVPTFGWAGVTATMPTGEVIRTIYQYVGSFVGIATNRGFRIGDIDQNGDIAYGPLLFEPDGGCSGIVGFDRFMWVGSTNQHDGASGLFRVDLGNSVQEQTTRAVRYAYARDIYYESTAAITSVTMFGASDRKVFNVTGVGAIRENATTLVPTGYLNTGRIRFNTEEPKLYKFFSIRTPSPLLGNVSVSILTEAGGEIPYVTYGPTSPSGVKDVGISQPLGPQNWIALKFTLARDSVDATVGGVMNGWQVKALPGSIRQRIITMPFLLFDSEKDKTYQSYNYEGATRDRLEAFKAVARAGDVVLFQELDDLVATQVVIDDWEFRQMGPPGARGSLGGILTVVMRTVAEST